MQEWQRSEKMGQRAWPTGTLAPPTSASHFTEFVLERKRDINAQGEDGVEGVANRTYGSAHICLPLYRVSSRKDRGL